MAAHRNTKNAQKMFVVRTLRQQKAVAAGQADTSLTKSTITSEKVSLPPNGSQASLAQASSPSLIRENAPAAPTRRKVNTYLVLASMIFCLLLCAYAAIHLALRSRTMYVLDRTEVQEAFSRVDKTYPVVIDVEMMYQNPELPNGCETVSMSMALRYAGYPISKVEFADVWLPRADYWGADPEKVYAGDPFGAGFYCYAPPLVEGTNNYLATQGGTDEAVDITGADAEVLYAYIRQGTPVVVWVTLAYDAPRNSLESYWLLEDGTVYIPYANLHCALLTGYDRNNVYLNDPLQGKITVPTEQFETVYEAMNRRAAVILPYQEAEEELENEV